MGLLGVSLLWSLIDPVTGAIIRPRDEEGNLIVKTRKPRKNKENAN